MIQTTNPFDPANGGWFCEACHSPNMAEAVFCAACQAPRLYAAPQDHARPREALAVLVAAMLVIALAVGLLGGQIAAGLLTSHRPSSPVAHASRPTPSAPPTTPSATLAEPSASATPTASPAPTRSPAKSPAVATSRPTAVHTAPPAATYPPGTVALPAISVSISGVSVSYYSITGETEDALISGVLSSGPTYCKMADAAACFADTFKWSYTTTTDPGTSVCTVSNVNFAATYSMIFPKWVGPSRVPAALAAWWRKVMDHFIWHESRHLAIARGYVPKFQAAIAGGPCDKAGQDAVIHPLSAQLSADQAAFDTSDRGWTWPAL